MAKIQPGLERISQLLKNVQFPWKAIHVAGTNGKGSICHWASSLLTHRLIRCGKFTSPHVIDRWDCISINDKIVDEARFRRVEQHYVQINQRESINASPFEILTATAFTLFNEERIQVGVIEVGMGGKLDATNILDNQAVSVISKIARDHQGFLGNTLEEIAMHKAGILRPNVPFVVNPQNEWNVRNVINQYAQEVGAGPHLPTDRISLTKDLLKTQAWRRFVLGLQPFQQDNLVLALLAVHKTLTSIEVPVDLEELCTSVLATEGQANRGRLHFVRVPSVFGSKNDAGRKILVDGAHNPDAGKELGHFVTARLRSVPIRQSNPLQSGWPVTWILAMTEGKDASQYLETILRSGDNVITTSFGSVDGMPWVKPMDPEKLLTVAKAVQPEITGLYIPTRGTLRALFAAKHLAIQDYPIVLTGSLYLAGDFYRECKPTSTGRWRYNPIIDPDEASLASLDKQERLRINEFLSGKDLKAIEEVVQKEAKAARIVVLQQEIKTLDEELERLHRKEKVSSRSQSVDTLDLQLKSAVRPSPRSQAHSSGDDNAPFSDEELVRDDGKMSTDVFQSASHHHRADSDPLAKRVRIRLHHARLRDADIHNVDDRSVGGVTWETFRIKQQPYEGQNDQDMRQDAKKRRDDSA